VQDFRGSRDVPSPFHDIHRRPRERRDVSLPFAGPKRRDVSAGARLARVGNARPGQGDGLLTVLARRRGLPFEETSRRLGPAEEWERSLLPWPAVGIVKRAGNVSTPSAGLFGELGPALATPARGRETVFPRSSPGAGGCPSKRRPAVCGLRRIGRCLSSRGLRWVSWTGWERLYALRGRSGREGRRRFRRPGRSPYQPHFWPLFCSSSQVFNGAK